jgi:uncharacterized protein with HEPN domain
MSKERNIIFIKHILDNIDRIENFSKGMSQESLKNDELRQYAIVRAIEIIGEAVKNLPKDFKDDNKDIPWKDIIGTRDIMIHKYFGIDLEAVWDIIEKDLPDLKRKLKKLV